MSNVFVIMQIGNTELDDVYYQAIKPAIESCGLEARRVDKHNQGGLLKSEIINFINDADIIVADITNERPNCYLEIGYTMGVDKFRNLILTVREDHFQDSDNYIKGGPKVHFDLGGYDILSWERTNLTKFKLELSQRIKRRLKIISAPSSIHNISWNEEWLKEQNDYAIDSFNKLGFKGATIIKFSPQTRNYSWSPQELNQASEYSQIHTFGWPIGVHIREVPEFKPKPRQDGVFAEIVPDIHKSYDYWAINRDGTYFTLSSLFEDTRKPNHIFVDTRVIRATEALLFCARFYSKLGLDPSTQILFSLGYIGIKGRILSSASSMWRLSVYERTTDENSVITEISISLQEIESNLVELVTKLTSPLFTLFDFYELPQDNYSELVNNFVNGKI